LLPMYQTTRHYIPEHHDLACYTTLYWIIKQKMSACGNVQAAFNYTNNLTFTLTLHGSGISGQDIKTSRDILVKVCEDELHFWHRYSLGPSSISKSFSQIPHTGQTNAVSSSTHLTVPATKTYENIRNQNIQNRHVQALNFQHQIKKKYIS
jgi:hypothetical protein